MTGLRARFLAWLAIGGGRSKSAAEQVAAQPEEPSRAAIRSALNRDIGKRIANAITGAGLTVTEASLQANVPVTTLRRWIAGQTAADIYGLARIAKLTGTSLDRLVYGDRDERRA